MTSLNSAAIAPAAKEKLKALGYATLEELAGAAQVSKPEMENYLGTKIDPLLAQAGAAPAAVPGGASQIMRSYPYALGVLLDAVPRPRLAFAITTPPRPASGAPAGTLSGANFVQQMPHIRDQGDRGTCVSFAALAAYEHELITGKRYQRMSEQFLFWDCKRNDQHPNEDATWLSVAFRMLSQDGVCLDATWPYNPQAVAGDLAQGPPPPGAIAESIRYRISGFSQLSPTSVRAICANLDNNRAVAFSIPVFNSWYQNDYVKMSGDITMPIPGETQAGGHAMCLVGYVPLPNNPELDSGRFIVRNSWGNAWGMSSPYGPGYGTIPFAYLANYGVEAYALE